MEYSSWYNKNIIIYIVQITALYNAMKMGWTVKKLGKNRYEMSKKMDDPEKFCLHNFLNQVTKDICLIK